MYDLDVGCSLKVSIASTIVKCHGLLTQIAQDFSQFSQIRIWENVCRGNGVSVQPYAHSHKLKVLKHLISV